MPASGEIVGLVIAALFTGYTGCLAWCMLTSYMHGRELSRMQGELDKLRKRE